MTINDKIIREVLSDQTVSIEPISKGMDGEKFKVTDSKGDKYFFRIKKDNKQVILPSAEEKVLKAVDSDYIIKPLVCGIFMGRRVMVRRYVEGEDLEEVLKKNKTLNESEIKKLALILADVVESLCEADAIHFDIKPANIIVDVNNNYKLVDFGAARFIDGLRNEKIFPGRAYMAPEVLRYLFDRNDKNRSQLTIFSDMYSIGAVLYSAATGKRLADFFKTSSDLLSRVPAPVRSIVKNFDPKLANLINRLIKKEPADRLHPGELKKIINGDDPKTSPLPIYFFKSKPRGEHKHILPIIEEEGVDAGLYWRSITEPEFNKKYKVTNILWEADPLANPEDITDNLYKQHELGVLGFIVPGHELDVNYDTNNLEKNVKAINLALKWRDEMSLEMPIFPVISISESLLKSDDLKKVQAQYRSQDVDGVVLRICVPSYHFSLDDIHLKSIANFIKPWVDDNKYILFDGDLSALPLFLFGVSSFISETYPKLCVLKERQERPEFARKPDTMYISNLMAMSTADAVTIINASLHKDIVNCGCPACENLIDKKKHSKWDRPSRRKHFVYTIPLELRAIKNHPLNIFRFRMSKALQNGSNFNRVTNIEQRHIRVWGKFLS